MKRILYLYGTLLWSLVQVFFFGCLISVINEYFIRNSSPKGQADIVALIIMIVIVIVGVLIDSAIRKYDRWYMMLLDAIVSPIRFILQIVTIVKFHQSGNSKNFAPRGGYYTRTLQDWVMYVLFSTISLSAKHQYAAPAPYTGPRVVFEHEPCKTKKDSTPRHSGYQPPKTPDVYSDEYQSRYWKCRDCRYFTTYKKEIEGFLITSIDQGWCTRHGTETHETDKCSDLLKK